VSEPALPDVPALITALERGAGTDDGEAVDLLDHALQCAALLAKASPDDLELQAAGLVHDIGSVLEPDRPATHAATGAAAVESLLGSRVAVLVGRHDEAKRYLVATDDDYRRRLSARSIETLAEQGGPLDAGEIKAFEAREHADALLVLRRADDAAKVAGREVAGLDAWRPVLEALAAP
jgi:predicted HD phosphohydrolase